MDSVFDILFLRRPVLNYICPPVCEVLFSGTSHPIIVLDSFTPNPSVFGLVRGGVGGFRLTWNRYPGAICYSVYQADNENEPFGTYHIIAECIPDPEFTLPPGRGPFRVTAITPDGETPPSDPIYGDPVVPPVTTPVITVEATDPDTACDESPGVFTFTRTAPLTGPLVINYTVGGTADPDVDYDALSGTATIPDGLAFVDVDVFPLDSGLIEEKTVTVTILPDAAYEIGTPDDALVTIGTCISCVDPGFWNMNFGNTRNGGITQIGIRAGNVINALANVNYFNGSTVQDPLNLYKLASDSGVGLIQAGLDITGNAAFFTPDDVGRSFHWTHLGLDIRYVVTNYISNTHVQVDTSNTLGTDRNSSPITATQLLDVVTTNADFFVPSDVGATLTWGTVLTSALIVGYTSPTEVQVSTSEVQLAQTIQVQLFFDGSISAYSIGGSFSNIRVNHAGDIAMSQSNRIVLYKVEDGGLPTLKVSGTGIRRMNKDGNILGTNNRYYYRDGTDVATGIVASFFGSGSANRDKADIVSQDSDRILEFQRNGTAGEKLRVWNNGVLTDLNPLPFPAPPTNGANQLITGQALSPNGSAIVSVVGFSPTFVGGASYWFIVDVNGASTAIPFVNGGVNGEILTCHAINDSKQWCGAVRIAGGNQQPVLGNADGTITSIPFLPGRTTGDAQFISSSGIVVGFMTAAGVRTAFVYFGGVTYDLNTYVPASFILDGWVLSIGEAITDDGYIFGTGKLLGVDATFLMCDADFI